MASHQTYTYNWYTKQFKEAGERARTLQNGGSNQLLFTKLDAKTWSAAECLAHLNSFGNIYFDNIRNGLEEAITDPTDSPRIFKPRLLWRGVIRIFEPPYKIKFKTLSIFEPDMDGTQDRPEHAFSHFIDLQERFTNQLQRCQQKGINLNAVKVSNPALPFIKMTLAECYAVAEAHQRRHLWQAEQILVKLKTESTR